MLKFFFKKMVPAQIMKYDNSITTNSTTTDDDHANEDILPFSLDNKKICLIGICIVTAITTILVILFLYRKSRRRNSQDMVIQFEAMHPHVVVVDADGNSVESGKTYVNEEGGGSTNEKAGGIVGGGKKNQSRIIKVVQCDRANVPEGQPKYLYYDTYDS